MQNEKKEYQGRIVAATKEYADVIVKHLQLNPRDKRHSGVAEGIEHGLEYAFMTVLHSDKIAPQDLLDIIKQGTEYQNLFDIE